MQLPQHVQQRLSLTGPIDELDLATHVERDDFVRNIFGLSGAEFSSAAADALSGKNTFVVIPAMVATKSWRYIEVSTDNTIDCIGLCTSDNFTSPPPTAASRQVVGAWFSDPSVINDDNISPQRCIWVVRTGHDPFSLQFVGAWGAAIPFLQAVLAPPVWVAKSQLLVSKSGRLFIGRNSGTGFKHLLLEAVSEIKNKWRYLSLYRIFEHGYLTQVYEKLSVDFFGNPKETLAIATSSLESELNQFQALAKDAALESYFEALHDQFEASRSAGNHFATALNRSMQNSSRDTPTKNKSQKGVLICYKIRCAIVHAGAAAPIFDSYSDAPKCLDLVLPECEAAVLEFLGVQCL